MIYFKVQHPNNENSRRKEIFKAVESCFSSTGRVQKNNTWLSDTLQESEDSDDGIILSEFHSGESESGDYDEEETEDSVNRGTVSDDNIFKHYDTSEGTEIDHVIQKVNRQFIRFRSLEKRLFRIKASDFKLKCIKTPIGRRFMCNFCRSISKSWGKGVAHIREVHTGIRLNCILCNYQTFNPDSLFHHKKRHH